MTEVHWQYLLAAFYAGIAIFALIVYVRRIIFQARTVKPGGHHQLLSRLAASTGAKFAADAESVPSRFNRIAAGHGPILVLQQGVFGDRPAWIAVEFTHPRTLPRLLVVISDERLLRRKLRIEPYSNLSLFDTNGLPKIEAGRFPFDQFLEHHHVFAEPRLYLMLRQQGVLRTLGSFYAAYQKRASVELRNGELTLSVGFTGAERRLNALFLETIRLAYGIGEELAKCGAEQPPVLGAKLRSKLR